MSGAARDPETALPGTWVLVTGDQGRVALTTVRALAKGGYRVAVTTARGERSLAAASRFCSRIVTVPAVTDPGYASAVRAELNAHPYLTYLAVSDAALLQLEAPLQHLLDKTLLPAVASRAGLEMPPSTLFGSRDELLEAAAGLAYPIIVKPTLRHHRTFKAEDAGELETKLARGGPVIVQPWMDAPIHSVGGVMWQGTLLAAVHQRWLRVWPRGAGQACAAVTTEPDHLLESRLVELLKGYEGIFNAQLLGPYLLDVHPRIYGTQPLALASGVNPGAIWCDLLRGKDVAPVRGRPGVFYRWAMGDLRHLHQSWREGSIGLLSALGQTRPHRNTSHGTESMSDLGPSFARLRYHLDRRRGGRPSSPSVAETPLEKTDPPRSIRPSGRAGAGIQPPHEEVK